MEVKAERGFAGSVLAQSVADLLQFNGSNRFSGSIVVSHGEQEAIVYMQHGEVVHAECGALRGEPVIGLILAWPTGNFEAHANMATFARTIDKRLEHLLLDAARFLDEARRDVAAPPPVAPPPARPLAAPPPLPATTPPPGPGAASRPPVRPAAERIRAVAGVGYATLLRGAAPLGDGSPEAAALASRGAFLLSMLAAPLGKALGLGEVTRAALSTSHAGQLLLLQAREAYLAVSLDSGADLAETEAEIRRAVSARPEA
jgi:hypothetical protein